MSLEISRSGTYVCVEIRKSLNLGCLIRCCVAFGCTGIILIGSMDYSSFGSHGSHLHLCYYHFDNWQEFLTYMQTKNIGYYLIQNTKLAQERLIDSIKIENVKFAAAETLIFVVEDTYTVPTEIQVNSVSTITVAAPNAVMSDKIDYKAKVAIVLQYYAAMVGVSANQFYNEKFMIAKSIPRNSKVISLSYSPQAAIEESADDITNGAMSALFGDEDA